jgi:hypothetical protein
MHTQECPALVTFSFAAYASLLEPGPTTYTWPAGVSQSSDFHSNLVEWCLWHTQVVLAAKPLTKNFISCMP